MNSKFFWRAVRIMAGLVLAVSTGALAQDPPPPVHFSGLINDYTSQTGVGGPWEIRGEWSLDLIGNSGTANLSAAVNMTHDDYWILLKVGANPGIVDDNTASGRHPHTHHITLQGATVTALPAGGFEVSGPVNVTADGAAAPFMSSCSPAMPCILTVDVTGGAEVPFSNVTLKFSGPPTGHFGSQAIHGFVRNTH